MIERARPYYQLTTGKRRGGWDAFFDFPPSHPDGTRTFQGTFTLAAARAVTIGNRLEIAFDGLRAGIFEGTIRYVFYPGSRLIEQAAVMSTGEPDTAYFYDAGLRMGVEADRRPGGNMESLVSYYDTSGELKTKLSDGPERQPLSVRYRTVAHISRAAPLLFRARLHVEHGLRLALVLARTGFARHPAVCR